MLDYDYFTYEMLYRDDDDKLYFGEDGNDNNNSDSSAPVRKKMDESEINYVPQTKPRLRSSLFDDYKKYDFSHRDADPRRKPNAVYSESRAFDLRQSYLIELVQCFENVFYKAKTRTDYEVSPSYLRKIITQYNICRYALEKQLLKHM